MTKKKLETVFKVMWPSKKDFTVSFEDLITLVYKENLQINKKNENPVGKMNTHEQVLH